MMKLTFEGKMQTIAEWAKELSISVTTLNRRRALGWSTERVIKEKLNRKIEGIAERDKLPDMSAWWREQRELEKQELKREKERSRNLARKTPGRTRALLRAGVQVPR